MPDRLLSAAKWLLVHTGTWMADLLPRRLDARDLAICIIHGVNEKSPAYLQELPWPRLQLDQLRRFTPPGYAVYVYCNDLLAQHAAILDEYPEVKAFGPKSGYRIVMRNVWAIRNWLAHEAAPRHRYIVHLDSDAFPVRDDWFARYAGQLSWHSPVVAVQRLENGDTHSDRCFLMYRRIDLHRHLFNMSHIGAQDAGGLISSDLARKGLQWHPLTRSNAHDYHPLVAGLYDDRIYHHAAGSREPLFRQNRSRWKQADFMAQEQFIHEVLMRRLFSDPDGFVAELRGERPPASLAPRALHADNLDQSPTSPTG